MADLREQSGNDIATKAPYLARHGQDADYHYHHDNLGFPGAGAAGLSQRIKRPDQTVSGGAVSS